MTSNENTPDSVLNAPSVTPIVKHETAGPNRRERRLMHIAKSLNTPYTDPEKRQAKVERLLKKKSR